MSAVYSNLGGEANSARPQRILDRMRQVLRTKHYAYSTEQAYVQWARRDILFHDKRHPQEMGGPEIESFLTHLAVEGHVSASTQTQALCAFAFFLQIRSQDRQTCSQDRPSLDSVRAKRPKRLPVML